MTPSFIKNSKNLQWAYTYHNSVTVLPSLYPILKFNVRYENSYGVVFAEWLDGDVLSFDIEVNTKVELVLSEEKVIRHKIKSISWNAT